MGYYFPVILLFPSSPEAVVTRRRPSTVDHARMVVNFTSSFFPSRVSSASWSWPPFRINENMEERFVSYHTPSDTNEVGKSR
jgi:hypothetical protein